MKWITFGGSYPGMLSAWSHLLHPTAIFAAVSSSSPIQAQLDFAAYHEHVGRDLTNGVIGGNDVCLGIVQEGHMEIAKLLEGGNGSEDDGEENGGDNGDGFERLASLFNVCGGAESLRVKRNQEVSALCTWRPAS